MERQDEGVPMPSRVIRGSINSSESLARVSLEADHLFRCLLNHVDDHGRYDARPGVLRGVLYPLRPEVTEADISTRIAELADIDEELPPVRLYEVDGRQYLELTGWEKHRGKSRRAETSRWPSPTRPPVLPEDANEKAATDLCGPPPRGSTEIRGDQTRFADSSPIGGSPRVLPEGGDESTSAERRGDPRGSARGVGVSRSRGATYGSQADARPSDEDQGELASTKTSPSRWAQLLARKHFRGDREQAARWVAAVLPEIEAAADAKIAGAKLDSSAWPNLVRSSLHAYARRRERFDVVSNRSRIVRPEPSTGSSGEFGERRPAARGVAR